ncbi:hypothetical protein BV25DRAFT_782643 [Artomyces pyxidatus]|uniref:Uncharacterized protein n=1 Tax=Artomyces pyxidatus TaxID=48021 RepID=A0ACB8SYS6_9AGAM|nr:hypothetical protein BV25DRAFT_782643 [Artomyces pyxidatus]
MAIVSVFGWSAYAKPNNRAQSKADSEDEVDDEALVGGMDERYELEETILKQADAKRLKWEHERLQKWQARVAKRQKIEYAEKQDPKSARKSPQLPRSRRVSPRAPTPDPVDVLVEDGDREKRRIQQQALRAKAAREYLLIPAWAAHGAPDANPASPMKASQKGRGRRKIGKVKELVHQDSLTCFPCKLVFNRTNDLARHLETTRVHMSSDSGEWRCERCGKVLSRKDALLRHLQKTRACRQRKPGEPAPKREKARPDVARKRAEKKRQSEGGVSG